MIIECAQVDDTSCRYGGADNYRDDALVAVAFADAAVQDARPRWSMAVSTRRH